jgi:hypothetical protein
MKLSALWQPGSPVFWQMVAFNVLSSLCAWALRTLPLNTAGLLLLGTVGLLNCAFGMLAMWRLLHSGSAPPGQSASGPSASKATTSE